MRLFIFLFILLLISCSEIEKKGSFSIDFIEFYPKNRVFLSVTESEITCIDWPHQSYLLKDSIANILDTYPGMGASPYMIAIKFNNRYLDSAQIISKKSSIPFNKGRPFIFYNCASRKLVWNNWLVIHNLWNRKKQRMTSNFFNMDFYNYISEIKLNNGQNWKCYKNTFSKNILDTLMFEKVKELQILDW